MFRKHGRWFVAAALLAAVAGALAYRHHHRYKHFAVHQPGMIYRSAWLEPDVLTEMIEKHQLRTVVNLCRPGELGEQRWTDERSAVENAGARLLELEMPPTVKVDDPAIERHVAALNDPDNYPMLVHCQHGVTRTAKFLAIYDIIYRRKSARESLAVQPLFGRDDHDVNVRAFAGSFERRHADLYPSATPERLSILGQ